ncbi:SH3 domain-containing protein [Petrocella sp. FN5]|uniref:SH3 domain-containing protein n=1 Tax=Petrocella sp. FN5 TaxID=3032002 RepID=UPI0023D99F90|nr:SH3 domain-containing protein [Petrocella sp. FN5]MDF1616773.1 SH3 domain-containing protein [Petrocella sp. FN5]
MNKQNRLKSFLIILVFILLTGCRPIEGLEPSEESTESIDIPVVDTTSEEVEPIPEPEERDALHVQIIADVLNVREEASINSAIVDKVKEDDVFEVLDEAVDADDQVWYMIKTDRDIFGWIFGAYSIAIDDEDVADTSN